MTSLLVFLYILSMAGLALFGLLGFFTLGIYIWYRKSDRVLPVVNEWQLPNVTIQLPVYNEKDVVNRLILAACRLDYPQERLQIQVLDDSTDETTTLARALIADCADQGIDISLLHRDNRAGFKAGALAAAMREARGDYIAIFDADFQPAPDFLRRTIPYFLADDSLGLVQARWGHLNPEDSALTAAQTVALDKHFVIEQSVRFRAAFFPKFNGSAGIWRRACLDDAGGWQADTVCEDLCLSTRAILKGWRGYYAADVVAPAELPRTILAYKQQQARWAMGSTQCLTKYGSSILKAREHSLFGRLYSILSMSAYTTHLLLLLLLIVQLPLLYSRVQLPSWMLVLSFFGLGQPLLFILAQQILYPDWKRRIRSFPILLLIAIGMAPSNSWAVMKALAGRDFTFLRTPKGEALTYRLSPDRMLAVEIVLAFYAGITLALSISLGKFGSTAFLASCLLGLGYMIILTIAQILPRWHHQPAYQE
jgi:cellulose synthase/poly-beta-1,6-N-acetylglucosamine synthase-like glycosyltransferase